MTVFAWLWASAHLAHMEGGWLRHGASLAEQVSSGGVVLVALALLFRPSELRLLAALAAAQVVDAAVVAPFIPNHWTLMGLVNLVLIGVITPKLWGKLDGAAIRGDIATPVRWGVAVFYLFTGFWKLNSGFFDLDRSCGVEFWGHIEAMYPFLWNNRTWSAMTVAFTMFLECVAPLFLLWGRTRNLSVGLFLFFHGVLTFDLPQHLINFSSTMWALLTLFLAEGLDERVLGGERTGAVKIVALGGALGWLLIWLLTVGASTPEIGHSYYQTLRYLLGLGVAAALVPVLWPALTATEARVGSTKPWVWVFPALVVFNGISPIIGWKNRTSWQMYSNLRLEAETSNHFVVPRSLDLLGMVGDRVHLVETDVEAWQAEYIDQGLDLTWHEFRREAALHPDGAVRWERGGQSHVTPRIGDDATLSAGLPWWSAKLSWFRPLGPAVEGQCRY